MNMIEGSCIFFIRLERYLFFLKVYFLYVFVGWLWLEESCQEVGRISSRDNGVQRA
jgi:hypothetical protein